MADVADVRSVSNLIEVFSFCSSYFLKIISFIQQNEFNTKGVLQRAGFKISLVDQRVKK